MPCNFQIVISVLLCSIGLSAPAATVHRWVDEDGVTHFSDAPPAVAVRDVKTLELSENFPAAPDTRADYYSIANQWERMREERDQKDQVALEKARIRADKAAAVAPSAPATAPEDRRYYPAYFPPAGNRGRAHRQPYQGFDDRTRRPAHNGRRIDGTLGRGERPGYSDEARVTAPTKRFRLR